MRKLIRYFFLVLLLTGALVARAATVTVTPSSQNISVGDFATVTIAVDGLTRGQAVGAFDLFLLNDASIIRPTSLTYYSFLGDSGSSTTATVLANGSAEGAEISFLDTSALLAMQTTPFNLFQLTYQGIAAGTSQLLAGPTFSLVDGDGNFIDTTYNGASITVLGSGGGTPGVTPEPSSLMLLGTGGSALIAFMRQRRRANPVRLAA